MNRLEAYRFRKKLEKAASSQTNEDALESVELFPKWKVGLQVSIGERYQYNSVLYKVIQAHTTQSDWTPDVSVSLFVEVSVEEWPEWKQPLGQQDAYMAGDKVTYNGQHYVSLIDNNVWSPEVTPQYWEAQP